ncbi:uncharacterized protein [Halyomorpha halys]|uniref:uncharacterized protein n=1 Tax=Halyomorpha halys TaxID=286706 RepID=UPI0006D4EF00
MAVLQCIYELGDDDNLYAVKWYKDNEEFYRYVPRLDPPQSSYSIQGIKVDHTMSDQKQVVLRSVNLKSSGTYKCEVSAEAPTFSSASSEAQMTVLFIPANGPHITGERKQLLIGDEVNLNCTSGKSFPASILTWYINEQQVSEDSGMLIRYPNTIHMHGLITTTLGLHLRVEGHHYRGGNIKLRCVASLSPVLWTGDRESVVGAPVIDQNREALLLVKGSGSRTGLSGLLLLFVVAAILT